MSIDESKKLLGEAEKNILELKRHAAGIKRVGIFYTRWYPEVVAALVQSAQDFLGKLEISESKIDLHEVSGSWELPLAIKGYLDQGEVSFALALGCVIKGETPHFDILCNTVATALMNLQCEKKIPIGLGILTLNTLEQALARQNKGAEASEAAFRSWLLLRETVVRNKL